MLALGAVIMLCAVAIIGAGYAAFSTTANARTYNEGNSVTAGYMTLTPGAAGSADWTAISTDAKAEYSAYTFQHSTNTYDAYYITDAALVEVTGVANGYYVKELGTAKTFTLKNETGAAINQVTFGAKAKVAQATDLGSNAEFKYFLKVVNGSNTPLYLEVNATTEQTGTLTLTSIPNEDSGAITVQLCVGYQVNCYLPTDFIGDVSATAAQGYSQAAHYSSADTPLAPEDMVNVSFAFSVLDTTA